MSIQYSKVDNASLVSDQEKLKREDTSSASTQYDNEPDAERPSAPVRTLKDHAALWLLELLASVLSLVCIAIIVIILHYEDGKPLDEWHLIIAPNALIAFFATIAKSTFLLVLVEVITQLKWLHFSAGVPRRLYDFEVRSLLGFAESTSC